MDDAILHRLDRIYSAIGSIEEEDLEKLRATVIRTEKAFSIIQDFRGGFSDADLSNYAHGVIHGIANLGDHLRRWAAQNGQDKAKVNETVDISPDLQIIIDLSNNDKHGYPPRNGGHSKKAPQLTEVTRLMRLQTQEKKDSGIGMTFAADGKPIFFGDGTAKAVITGDVVDAQNNRIGDLYDISINAVGAWEKLITHFGLIPVTD